jgi:hypothetical protein
MKDDFDGFVTAPTIGVFCEPDVVVAQALSRNLVVGVGRLMAEAKTGDVLNGNPFPATHNS